MATCLLQPVDICAVTNINGHATLKVVFQGDYTLEVSYVGFETIKQKLNVNRTQMLTLRMVESSLALNEVMVVARQNASSSGNSIIGRQAIDHLQATSLADVMQLIPGHLMGSNDMLSATNLPLCSLVNNNTSAFGSSIVIDGMPMSNNGDVIQGNFSSTSFVGTDLRNIAADDINEVEVVRGIPSAEYGDLTSGHRPSARSSALSAPKDQQTLLLKPLKTYIFSSWCKGNKKVWRKEWQSVKT